jgi:hypothetical protein
MWGRGRAGKAVIGSRAPEPFIARPSRGAGSTAKGGCAGSRGSSVRRPLPQPADHPFTGRSRDSAGHRPTGVSILGRSSASAAAMPMRRASSA